MPPLPRHLLAAALLVAVPGVVGEVVPVHRVAVCFAPGTPLGTQDAMKAAVAAYQADDDARWSRTATDGSLLRRGEPTTLTWSIVPDGTPIPGYFGEGASDSDLRAWLTSKYGSEAAWMAIFESVFERWSELTGITYVHEPADDGSTLADARGVRGVRADIRIGGHRIDGTSQTLAYNFYPDDGDMVIDTSDRYFDNTSNASRRLRNVIAHEHGHGLGLDHVCPIDGTKLMEPTSSTAIDGPQLDDVLAAQRLYGDRFETADTPASATALGTLPPGKTVVDDVSIDGSDDVDVYAFAAAPGSQVDVVLVPVGATYLSGAQSSGGSCSSGSTFDALRRLDLSVELIGPDGGTRLAFADAARSGGTEELVDVALGSAATHFVRVRGDADDVQLYRLVLDVSAPVAAPRAVDDTVTTQDATPARVNVLANDEGAVSGGLRVVLTSQPAHGLAVPAGGGVVRYSPNRGFSGVDTFTYALHDGAGDVSAAKVTVTVERTPRAGNASLDTDEDLYPDELEEAFGTSASSAGSRPAEGGPAALSPRAAKATLRFRKTGRDDAQLRATFPLGATTDLHGLPLDVYVGGWTRRFTLDRKGRARADADRVRVRVSADGRADLTLKVRRADLAADWDDEGLSLGASVRDEYRELTVFVVVAGTAAQADLPLRYSVRRDKGKPRLLAD